MAGVKGGKNTRKTPAKKGKLLRGNEKGQGFSSTNQPSPESKSAGHAKKRLLREIVSTSIAPDADFVKKIKEKFPELIDSDREYSLEELIQIRLLLEGIAGDRPVAAIKEVNERLYGKVAQTLVIKVELDGFNQDLLTDEQLKVFLHLLEIGMEEKENDGSLGNT